MTAYQLFLIYGQDFPYHPRVMISLVPLYLSLILALVEWEMVLSLKENYFLDGILASETRHLSLNMSDTILLTAKLT